jgi:prolipoprotein diacylglyceryltransferase
MINMSTTELKTNQKSAMCENCGKSMPSYAKFCYECGIKVVTKTFGFENTEITGKKDKPAKFLDFVSIILMATFGAILGATVGFVLLYYSLFYLNYLF